jgi:hypothetical protein
VNYRAYSSMALWNTVKSTGIIVNIFVLLSEGFAGFHLSHRAIVYRRVNYRAYSSMAVWTAVKSTGIIVNIFVLLSEGFAGFITLRPLGSVEVLCRLALGKQIEGTTRRPV